MLTLVLSLAAQAAPMELTHTGRLMDGTGLPLQGSHNLTVSVHLSTSSGTPLWSETIPTTFEDGYFTVVLGTDSVANPIQDDVFDGATRYLGIAVDGGTELPDRQPIVSVPYAIRAGTAVDVDGGVVDASEIRVDGTVVIDSSGTFVGSGGDGDTLASLTCVNGQVALFDGVNWGCSALTVQWDDLSGVPGDLTDGDADQLASTVCLDGQVLKYASPSGWACADDIDTVDPDTDTVLTEVQVETFIENGPIDLASGTTLNGAAIVTDWTNLPSIPAGFADNVDDDLLAALPCGTGEVAKMSGSGWTCAADDVLTEADVEAFIENGDLDVAGTVRVGTTSTACGAGMDGAIRWDSGNLEVCDGVDWQTVWANNNGSSPGAPGTSCLQIKTDFPASGDGPYWIDPLGVGSYEVYCDMTTDGGGWTLVATLDDGGTDVWSQLNPTQNTGLWEDGTTLGSSPDLATDYKSQAFMDLTVTSLLVKQDGATNVLQAEACWSAQTFHAFFAAMTWNADGSDSNWADGTPAAHRCAYTDFGYEDPVLRAQSSPKELGFKWGERDGVQDTNKDRVMITTSNANGSNHHVDSPTGLGGFAARGALISEDVNECQGDAPNDCSDTNETYNLFVR